MILLVLVSDFETVIMSAAAKEDDTMQFCACCGTAGGDDIKLKKCTACYLVRYCSVKCQREHRPKHKRECKKRVAELYDELLFKQPESSHLGDCPICFFPLPLDPIRAVGENSIITSCCTKQICMGCDYANRLRERKERLPPTCPFCREDLSETDEEMNERWIKRAEANDPIAMNQLGTEKLGEVDYKAAFEYFTRAAALGDAEAHYHLYTMYQNGKGVEEDRKRELHHAEQAAIGGHPVARHNLACMEGARGQHDRAVKHLTIAAKLGYDKSLEHAKTLYKAGAVSKDDFTAILRGYQAAIVAAKSPQREEAYEFLRQCEARKKLA